MKKININILAGYIILTIIAVSTSIVGIYIVRKFQKEQPPQVVIVKPEERPSQYPDYEAYKSLTKVNLVKDNTSFVTRDYKKIGEVTKKIIVSGKFRRAYVYINASVDNGKPLTIYDSIYMTLNRDGGHLLRNKSLAVPASDVTQLLYDLRMIPYIKNVPYSEDGTLLFANWLKKLNSQAASSIYTFLSSWRAGGLIKEITIAFECEENSKCDILVE